MNQWANQTSQTQQIEPITSGPSSDTIAFAKLFELLAKIDRRQREEVQVAEKNCSEPITNQSTTGTSTVRQPSL